MNGLTLLLWIVGLTFLWMSWRIAVAMYDAEPTPDDACMQLDAALDAADARYP